jgi:hypothetical protein
MARTGLGVGLLLAVAAFGAACVPQVPRPIEPSQASLSLHGFFGDETFIDVLEKFLLPGQDSPLPGGWEGRLPLLGYPHKHSPWYLDKKKGGQDEDHDYGLESSTLAFFSGHGDKIKGWWVPDPPREERVPLNLVRAGDGSLRYFWLYSCGVLAHGPKAVKNAPNYSAPQCFRPGVGHADVFDRWSPAIGPGMRMVCGGSTSLGQTGVGEIWNYLLEAEASVADAWILGLNDPEEISVCLARGGKDPASSALADRTLETDAVPQVQKGWLHFQYSVDCKIKPNSFPLHVICNKPSPCDDPDKPLKSGPPLPDQEALPTTVPSVEVVGQKPGGFLASAPANKSLPLGFLQLAGHESLKYHPKSGAIVLIKGHDKVDRYNELASCDAESEWIVQPSALLKQADVDLGALAADSIRPGTLGPLAGFSSVVLEMRVESRPDDGSEPRQCTARSLFLLLRRSVPVGPNTYPVFGPAIAFELQRQGDGDPSLASFSAPHLDLSLKEDSIPLKPLRKAVREAHRALQLNSLEYPLKNARATFGYERAPLRCQQEFLRPTYEIRFFPSKAARPDRPTVTVRRDARLNPSDVSWKCQGWGDFPPP